MTAFAAKHHAAALSTGAPDRLISRLVWCTAANTPHATPAVDQRDRQKDGQTDGLTLDRFTDPAPHSMLAVSMNCTGSFAG